MALRSTHYYTREQAAHLAEDHRSLAASWRELAHPAREAWHLARALVWQRYADGEEWCECLHSSFERPPWLGQAA